MEHDKIAVVDFGGQYAHLIATKIRRLDVLAEIRQPEEPKTAFTGYKGIVLSGGPALISKGEDSDYNAGILDLEIPVLGLCYGHQEIANRYGGKIAHGGREWGHAALHIVKPHPILKGLDSVEQVWMSHFDSVVGVGQDFEELAYTVMGDQPPHRFAAVASDKHKRYGFQFHAEVDDTPHGDIMLRNFILDICGCNPTWTMGRYIDEQIERIQAQVGDQSVFLLASGGVDSTVAAKLFGMALGSERLHLLHVDNGLMRKDESRKVIEMFNTLGLGENLHFADAGETFLRALKGVTDPEEKRRIIGTTFVEVFEEKARALGIEDHLLGQGTIYPDTIETGATKRSHTIKTHHNRVPMIEKLIAEGKVVEPLAELYKVEVRELGEKMGILPEALWRHPFPGPGLGVRLLCSKGDIVPSDLAPITAEVLPIAARCGVDAVVLPVRSVGVKADVRSYEHPVMITSGAGRDSYMEAANALLKGASGINRCILNLSPKSPGALRPLAAETTRERLDILREADEMVMQGLKRHGIYDDIWQCPTVLIPLEIDGKGEELVVIRPIHSERAMTAAAAALPDALIRELWQGISGLPKVSGVALDLTSKPPGTIEWE